MHRVLILRDLPQLGVSLALLLLIHAGNDAPSASHDLSSPMSLTQAPQPAASLIHLDLLSLQRRFSTELFYIDSCDVGLGLFARQHIAPGQRILALEGPIIDFAETKRRGPRECMAIQIGPNRYIDTQPPGVYVNHSCDPNAGIMEDKYLVALRHIPAQTEIRFDYSTTMEEASFTMDCLCGAPECRRRVTDFSTLPPEVKARYIRAGAVMSFILAAPSFVHGPQIPVALRAQLSS